MKRADVKTDRDGRSSGCAVVYFETHRGASSAIGEYMYLGFRIIKHSIESFCVGMFYGV